MIKELSDRLCSSTITHSCPSLPLKVTAARANQTMVKQHTQKTLSSRKRVSLHHHWTRDQGPTPQTSPRTTGYTVRRCTMETAHRFWTTTGLCSQMLNAAGLEPRYHR